MDYLEKYGVKNYRKFQEGGAAAPPPAGPEGGAPGGAPGGGAVDPMVQDAAQLLMQIAEAAMAGDPQAGEMAVQIAQAVTGGGGGGGAEGAPPPPVAMDGGMVYRSGGRVGGPSFRTRSALVARK